MSVPQACRLLDATQARYGMASKAGRAALAHVKASITTAGEGAAIRRAAAGELSHQAVNETSPYNADWVGACLLATGTP